jgi:hypothetical protein
MDIEISYGDRLIDNNMVNSMDNNDGDHPIRSSSNINNDSGVDSNYPLLQSKDHEVKLILMQLRTGKDNPENIYKC